MQKIYGLLKASQIAALMLLSGAALTASFSSNALAGQTCENTHNYRFVRDRNDREYPVLPQDSIANQARWYGSENRYSIGGGCAPERSRANDANSASETTPPDRAATSPASENPVRSEGAPEQTAQ